MPVPVNIPKLGMAMTEAVVVQWLVEPGDPVDKQQVIAEIETDKIVNELESPAAGTMGRPLVNVGDTASVAETIVWILLDSETEDDIPKTAAQEPPAQDAPASAPVAANPNPPQRAKTKRSPSSPAVRRLAREMGVDLSAIAGSGPEGRIVKEDILQAGKVEQPGIAEPLSAMRKAIARTVTQSAAIPRIVLYSSVDVSALVNLRERDKQIAYDDMFAFCIARTLKDHRYLNASFEESAIRLFDTVNLGMAVAVEDGMMIPVIRQVETLSLEQIGFERQRMVQLVRSRKITPQDMLGGTFTITNLGMYPVDSFEALISPPQAAILSIGRIDQKAMPGEDGGVLFQPTMTLGLTVDHRVADGAAGAAFLKDLIAHIESLDKEDH